MAKGFSDIPQAALEPLDVAAPRSARGERPIEAYRVTLRVGPGGRVVIPAEVREAMGLDEGDSVLATLESDRELRMVSMMSELRDVQRMMAELVPAHVSLADELIADRRAEVAREIAEEARDAEENAARRGR